MKKGGRETSVRMRNGGGGDEGSSGRRETRADGSRHVTGSATARGRRSSARSASQTRPPGRISRGFFLADARKPKRTSRSFSTRRRSAFRPERAVAARRNARESAGKTYCGVTERVLTSGDTSARRRREECAPGTGFPTRFGNASKRRGACPNGIKPKNLELKDMVDLIGEEIPNERSPRDRRPSKHARVEIDDRRSPRRSFSRKKGCVPPTRLSTSNTSTCETTTRRPT